MYQDESVSDGQTRRTIVAACGLPAYSGGNPVGRPGMMPHHPVDDRYRSTTLPDMGLEVYMFGLEKLETASAGPASPSLK
jgi:hypothetical protein